MRALHVVATTFSCAALLLQTGCIDWEQTRRSANGLAVGNTCQTNPDCATGFCVDGICCDSACEGQCEACNGTSTAGRCLPATGHPVGTRGACTGDGTRCGGACDGSNRTACIYPDSPCRSAACTNGERTDAAACNQGVCPAEAKHACGLGECANASECLGVVSFSTGNVHSCAALSNGTVRCWGDGSFSQLGLGADKNFRNIPTPIPGLTEVVEVACGGNHNCVRHRDGTVSCWGYSNAGQALVVSSETPSPIKVPGLVNIRALGMGESHSCAISDSNRAVCWGLNAESELGTGSTSPITSATPRAVCAMGTSGTCGTNVASNIQTIAGGNYHTCFLTTSGDVACWGLTNDGRTGQPEGGSLLNPTLVPLAGRVAVGLDLSSASTCVATSSGAAVCWGAAGALGDPTASGSSPFARTVCTNNTCSTTLLGVQSIAMGSNFGCAIRLAGALSCWGQNDEGQLGDGTFVSSRPFAVSSTLTQGVTRVSLGGGHGCVLLGPEDLRCFGTNATGQLGNGDPALASQSSAVAVKWK